MNARKKHVALHAATLAVAILAGCTTPTGHEQEQAGTVIGGIVGGVVGSQIGGGSGRTAATIVGAIAGGLIGGRVGQSMDASDRMRAAQALESNRTGAPAYWRNPDSGQEYTVTPTRTWQTAQGPCREYTMDSVIGGRPEKVYGTACRQPDGSWRAVN